ncbi:MAG: YraN family protein [Nitrospirota bacterium]|jgi:putative endonuclease
MKVLGIKGENLAVKFLKEKGYRIIARNYKTPIGEIDIIAQDGTTTVFIEVKTRTDEFFGQPFEAVNKRKRQKLKNVALFYLKRHERAFPVRFDVLSIFYRENGKKEIEHIKDAFEV